MRSLLPCVLAGCSVPLQQARLDPAAAPTDVEIDAADRARQRSCGTTVGYLWPGIGQACLGKPVEAAVLASLAGAELGAGIGLLVATPASPRSDALSGAGRVAPFIALQNVWVASVSLSALDLQRAQWLTHVPQDSLRDLVIAPFNLQVLKRPAVFGGIAVLSGAAIAINAVDGGRWRTHREPNLFGATVDPAVGAPLAAASGVLLFEHVAIGEELAFRGLLQPELVRLTGSEPGGWALASLAFGGLHAVNAAALPDDEVGPYLATAVPWITVTGSWIGLTSIWSGYSLAPPVAVHFWYDLLLSAADYAQDPQTSLLSAQVVLTW